MFEASQLIEEASVGKELTTTAGTLALIASLVVLTFAAGAPREHTGAQTPARSAASLYAKNCSSCHGKDGRAKTFKAKFNHARNLTDPEWQGAVSEARIFNSIANGRGKMPPFSKKMSEAEINALVLYVRGLKS